MLRKVRREGLTSEQLAALGGSSRIDDSEPRIADSRPRQDARRQGQDRRDRAADGRRRLRRSTQRRAPEFYNAPTAAGAARHRQAAPRGDADAAATAAGSSDFVAGAPAPAPVAESRRRRRRQPAPLPRRAAAAGAARRLDMPRPSDFGQAFAVDVSEVAHDPELDEAVIAFANADFEQCEQSLLGADRPRRRARAARRDLAGAVRPVPRHRPAAQVREPGARLRAAVRLVGAAVVLAAQAGRRGGQRRAAERRAASTAQVGWVCPDVPRRRRASRELRVADAADAAALGVRLGRAADASTPKPRPAVRAVPQLGPAGRSTCAGCRGERLFTVLQEAAPTGVRDADPAFWQLRLDALRMANRPDQFDEAAIDYCVTYEVSPPSWEPAKCSVRISGSSQSHARRRRCRWSATSRPASSSRS